ncbi:SH3 domain-containing protein [Xanthobacter autotrophicus]|uniref:SH3 domain-containing protein n=1 Tax=Xanthobacter autotrophicus TaxID=280 RepID=UPI0037286377
MAKDVRKVSPMRFGLGGIALALGLVLGGAASAATPGVALTNVNLRAGPSVGFPVVTVVPARAAIVTYGCLADTSWCDVSFAGARGWIAASYIQVVYAGAPVVLAAPVAPAVGVAVVGFSQAYWNAYYVGRPWYGQWNRYYGPYARGPVVHAGATRCSGGTCTHVGVTRGPAGNVIVRRGTISR